MDNVVVGVMRVKQERKKIKDILAEVYKEEDEYERSKILSGYIREFEEKQNYHRELMYEYEVGLTLLNNVLHEEGK
mgnify:CR=1 FL=1